MRAPDPRRRVRLDAILFDIWQSGGGAGTNIEPIVATSILLIGQEATLDNFELEPGAFHTIALRFDAHHKWPIGPRVFSVDAIQYSNDDILGGVRFVLKTPIDLERGKWDQRAIVFDGADWIRP